MKRCKHKLHKDVEIINSRFYMVCMNCKAVLYEIGNEQIKGLVGACTGILADLSKCGGRPINVQSPRRHITRRSKKKT